MVGAVNPRITVTLQTSAGYTTGPSGKRTPAFNAPVNVIAQVQELTTRDLRQLEGLNISGSSRKIYLYGQVNGTVRVTRKGGDLIILPEGALYLTTAVLEQWPDWCCVAVTLQDGFQIGSFMIGPSPIGEPSGLS